MDDLQKAMAEFAARNGVTECPPAGDKATYKAARKESWQAQQAREKDARNAVRVERNAENRRYDNEGVYYVGGYQAPER